MVVSSLRGGVQSFSGLVRKFMSRAARGVWHHKAFFCSERSIVSNTLTYLSFLSSLKLCTYKPLWF